MKMILALMLTLTIVSGCGTTKLATIETVYEKQKIPSYLTDCAFLKNLPDTAVLSDHQVAEVIVRLDTRLAECVADAKAIRKLVDEEPMPIPTPRPQT